MKKPGRFVKTVNQRFVTTGLLLARPACPPSFEKGPEQTQQNKENDRPSPNPLAESLIKTCQKVAVIPPSSQPIVPEPISRARKMVRRIRKSKMPRPQVVSDYRREADHGNRAECSEPARMQHTPAAQDRQHGVEHWNGDDQACDLG